MMTPRTHFLRIRGAAGAMFCCFLLAAQAPAQTGPLTITAGPVLMGGVAGQPYAVQLTATGGNGNYSWYVEEGSALPTGLTLDTNGYLHGTLPMPPLGTAAFGFTVFVESDDSGTSGPLTIPVLSSAPATPLSVNPATPPPAEVNQPYSYTFTATVSGAAWSLQAAPSWLSINSGTGVLSGTPTAPSQASFTVVAAANNTTASVPAAITTYPAVTIELSAIPPATVSQPYSQQVAISGGPGQGYFVTATGLPQGLTMSTGGVISGAAITAGVYPLAVAVKDTAGYVTTINAGLTVLLKVTAPTLPSGIVGVTYSGTLAASGGSGTYTWSGAGLPPGVSVSAGGQLSGTPSAAGTYPATFSVKDSQGNSGNATFTIQVAATPISITTTGLPAGKVGTPYSATLEASVAGTVSNPGIAWSTSGGLPPGLALSSAGLISGTPGAAGNYTFTAQASAGTLTPASANFTITIAQAPPSSLSASLPATLTPGSQPAVTITVSPAYPAPIPMTATAMIAPDLNGGMTDLGFENGSRSTSFTIPANTGEYQLPFSAGTSAGMVTMTLALSATGQAVTVSGPLTLTGQIAAQAPVIRSVTAVSNSSTLNVTVTGFSDTRDMKTAQFHFTAASGARLVSTDFSVDVSSVFSTWFANPASYATGSQFKLTVPFTIGGSARAISSVTVTLTNSNSASAPGTATVQ